MKGAGFLEKEVEVLQRAYFNEYAGEVRFPEIEFESDYHFGGYAKTSEELMDFNTSFEKETGIPTDRIYTAKMFYALYDMVKKDYFRKGSTVIAVHTGGLQGENT